MVENHRFIAYDWKFLSRQREFFKECSLCTATLLQSENRYVHLDSKATCSCTSCTSQKLSSALGKPVSKLSREPIKLGTCTLAILASIMLLIQKLSFQCYHDTSKVTEELVQKILLPGLEPGAVDVFLEFICYSGGPLPEELLPQLKVSLVRWLSVLPTIRPIKVTITNTYGACFFHFSLQCPVLIGWGDKDPWEPIELGREYGKFDSVEDFVVLPNVGHCPQVSLSLTNILMS